MKKLLPIVFALLCISTAGAEEYKPMLTDGKMWKCVTKGDHFNSGDASFTVTVVGDTIVNGKACKKLQYDGETEFGKKIDYCRVAYEEDGKVYTKDLPFYFEYEDKFILVFDFNMHKNDKTADDHTTVEAEDYVYVDGEKVHRVKFGITDRNGISPVWVEGVGPNTDFILFTPPTYIPTTTGGSDIDYMLECYDNGKLIYTADDFLKGWDTNGIALPTAEKTARGNAYDISGKPTNAPHKGEIYIRDGKKQVMR